MINVHTNLAQILSGLKVAWTHVKYLMGWTSCRSATGCRVSLACLCLLSSSASSTMLWASSSSTSTYCTDTSLQPKHMHTDTMFLLQQYNWWMPRYKLSWMYIQFGEHLHRVSSEAGLLFKDLLFEHSSLTVTRVLLQSLTDVVQTTYAQTDQNIMLWLLCLLRIWWKASSRKSRSRTKNLYACKDDIKQHSQQ